MIPRSMSSVWNRSLDWRRIVCVSTCRNARLLLKLQYWVLIMAEINLSLTVLQRMRHPSIPIAGQCLNFEYMNDIPISTMLKKQSHHGILFKCYRFAINHLCRKWKLSSQGSPEAGTTTPAHDGRQSTWPALPATQPQAPTGQICNPKISHLL